MFDIGAAEILIILVVAVAVIGPKDMPGALRQAGRWLGKMRRMSNHVRSGIDTMIREAEMEDMEKEWKAQNERIMREHPQAAENIAEFEPNMHGHAARVETPDMRPLAPPHEAPPVQAKVPSTDNPDELPPASELPQLPFGEDEKGGEGR